MKNSRAVFWMCAALLSADALAVFSLGDHPKYRWFVVASSVVIFGAGLSGATGGFRKYVIRREPGPLEQARLDRERHSNG
jgi:hypothetical protein